jgi:hypothetical protein
MQATYVSAPHQSQHHLDEVVEPLASYICAADRPTEALRRVVAKLLEEVKTTNAAAVRYFSVTSLHSLDLAV